MTLLIAGIVSVNAHAGIFGDIFKKPAVYQILDIPGLAAVDTTGYGASLDSLSAEVQADTTATSLLYSRFLKMYGNGSDGIENGMFSVQFIPMHDDPESLIVYVRGDSTTADSCKVQLTLKDTDGTVYVNQTLSVTASDTWTRKAYALSATLKNDLFQLILVAYMGQSYYMDISPAYLK